MKKLDKLRLLGLVVLGLTTASSYGQTTLVINELSDTELTYSVNGSSLITLADASTDVWNIPDVPGADYTRGLWWVPGNPLEVNQVYGWRGYLQVVGDESIYAWGGIGPPLTPAADGSTQDIGGGGGYPDIIVTLNDIKDRQVPDGGLTLVMLGMGVYGLTFIRRKSQG
jgi:hypothetical protein